MPEKENSRRKLTGDEDRDLDVRISFMEGLIRRDPAYVEALQVLGDDYTRRGRFVESLKIDERLSQLLPADAQIQYNLACSHSLNGNFNHAASALVRALDLVPAVEFYFMNVTIRGRSRPFRTVAFDEASNSVQLVEQRLLPHKFEVVALGDFRRTARAIKDMVVRGAGAIGATAAYGLAQGVRAYRGGNLEKFAKHAETVFQTLKSARPTAVDPVNAMNQVSRVMMAGETVEQRQSLALAAAEEFANEDVRHCADVGRHGLKLIRSGMNILTHCNAGWLAFVDIGTATAPMYAAQAAGKSFHVFCDETRPRAQGATLTAWELAQQKISHQIIADNAAGHLMQRGKIDLVIVGSDRTLGRTGEVANKIGTYTKAVLAKRHGIPFYVAIPLSTIDWQMRSGFDIPIEERTESEVLGAWGITSRGRREYVRVANPGSGALNPGFDVTPAELITGIITPAGIFKPGELWARRKQLGFV